MKSSGSGIRCSWKYTVEAEVDCIVDDTLYQGCITATLEIRAPHTITATAGPNGTITPSGAVVVADNTDATFTLQANPGYVLDQLDINGQAVPHSGNSYTFLNVTADQTIHATFAPAPVVIQYYTITVLPSPGGTISPNTATARPLESWTFTITPDAGSEIVDVLADGVSVGAVGSYTFPNIQTNHTIQAIFRVIPTPSYYLTVIAGSNGSVSPSSGHVVRGQSISIAIMPAAGYMVDTITVNGVPVTPTTILTLSNVTMDQFVMVQFKRDDSAPIVGGMYFNDVRPQDWYYDSVLFVSNLGLMEGTGSGAFSPDMSITRAMLVTTLWRYDGSPAGYTSNYSDVGQGSWYADAVAWASVKGIVNGIGGNRFDPNGMLTREQLVAILYRFAVQRGYQTGSRADLSRFQDNKLISAYAVAPMQWAVAANMINGKTDTAIDPHGSATRAEVAAILTRFIRNVR